MIEAALQVTRYFHFAGAATLFGTLFFPFYAPWPRRYPAGAMGLARSLPWAVLTFLTACIWLVLTAASMAGSFAAVGQGETWSAIFLETEFGMVWATRIALAALIIGLCVARPPMATVTGRGFPTMALAGVLLVTLAGVGHTQMQEGLAQWMHMGADALHLLAAGAWLGGLIALQQSLKTNEGSERIAILMRFSGMGYLAVAVLVATGLINSWFLVGTVARLFESPYGRLLLAKIIAFGGMLGLAALNRFWLVPRMRIEGNTTRRAPSHLARLQLHVYAELGLGVVVLLLVSVLGTIQPAAGAASLGGSVW